MAELFSAETLGGWLCVVAATGMTAFVPSVGPRRFHVAGFIFCALLWIVGIVLVVPVLRQAVATPLLTHLSVVLGVVAITYLISFGVVQLTNRGPTPNAAANPGSARLCAKAKGLLGLVEGRRNLVEKTIEANSTIPYANWFQKINGQRVPTDKIIPDGAPEFLLPNQITALTELQLASKDLSGFIDEVIIARAGGKIDPKGAAKGYGHRLRKFSAALELYIKTLEGG